MALVRPLHSVALLLSALSLLLLSACSSETPDTGAFDKASVQVAQDELDRYFEARDFDTLVEIGMPDVLIEQFMTEEGFDKSDKREFRTLIASELETAFATITLVEYESHVDKARIKTTKTGRPYAFVPTEMELETQGILFRAEVDMLAVVEEGRWYFLNPADDETIRAFKSALPDLEPLNIKPQKTTVISR